MRCSPAALLVGALVVLGCQGPSASLDELYDLGHRELRLGDLEKAQETAVRGQTLARQRAEEIWQRAFQVLEAEILASQRLDEEALARLGPVLEEETVDPSRVRSLMTLGFLQCRSAQNKAVFDAAHESFHLATEAARALSSEELEGEVDLRRGTCFFLQGVFPKAEEFFDRAFHTAQRLGIAHLEANAAGSLGLVRTRTGRFDEATLWLERSLVLAEGIGAEISQAKTLANLGWVYFEVGDYERALSILARAEARTERLGLLGDRLAALNNMGRAHFHARRWAQARHRFDQALVLARQLGDRIQQAQILSNLAVVSKDERNFDEAEERLRQAQEILSGLGNRFAERSTRLSQAYILTARGLFNEAESICRDLIDSQETELDLRWQSHGILALIHARSGRTEEAEAEFGRARHLMDESQERLLRLSHRLTFFTRLEAFYENHVAFLVDTGRPVEALEMAEKSRARRIRERLNDDRGDRLDQVVVESQRIAQETGAVLLSYWTAPDRSFLWVVDEAGVDLHSLPPEGDLREEVEIFQSALLQSRDPLQEKVPQGERLWRQLVAPAMSRIQPGSRVVVVPDGPLHQLNFESLVVPEPQPHFWIEDVVLSTTPSLAVLGASERPASGSGSILLLGDPEPVNEEFPRLAHASREMDRIAELFPNLEREVVSGARAEPSAYASSNPERFDYIHLAAHVTANPEVPLDSAVVLSNDGNSFKLYARDVIGTPIQAELVTLSACRSAGARAYAGEGLVGLAWAFMSAGAQHVIGGLWDVEDASTAKLMEHLYQGLRSGEEPAQALREAKLRLLRSETAYRKPFYWAPFVVYQGPSGA